MTKEELTGKVIEALRMIQDISGRPVETITEDTRPIGGLSGFDSLNGVELAVILDIDEPKGLVNLCASRDGRRVLTVRQIVEQITDSTTSKKGRD